MKQLLYIVGVLGLFAACNAEHEGLQHTWILKHEIYDNESLPIRNRCILKFKEDSLKCRTFSIEIRKKRIFSWSNRNLTIQYKVEGDNLLLVEYNDPKLFYYTLSNDSLFLDVYTPIQQNFAFVRLPKYNLAGKEYELRDLLLSSNVVLNDSLKLEFREDNKLQSSSLSSSKYWYLHTFENELFLVMNGMTKELVHIKEIGTDFFKGTLYDEDDVELNFKTVASKIKYNKEYLLGDWVAESESIKMPDTNFFVKSPMPPKELYIKDSILIINNVKWMDTLKWEMSRESEWIVTYGWGRKVAPIWSGILNNSGWRINGQWNIKSLDQNNLIIERLKRNFRFPYESFEIEQTKFIKK